VLSVFANNGPFSHGIQSGELIKIHRLGKSIKRADGNELKPADISFERPILAICLSNISDENSDKSPNILKVYVPDHSWESCKEQIVGVDASIKPFSLNFSSNLERSITGTRLGFLNRVYEWGIDGTVNANGMFISPYIAPNIHAIDHPDYVLMYIEEGKKGTTIQHRNGNNVTMPFAKIVLYPLFREERMIPKETMLMSGESLTTLTIYFRNPDDTPYNFHGAEFSFTLNFIV
jgi:hypothetical protein